MDSLSMKNFLEAGVHFGHQVRSWDPRMKSYIYTERNGIHIIDLQCTVEKSKEAYAVIRDTAAERGAILFVGTKKQAQKSVRSAAEKSAQFYVTERWLGGTLTNFVTIRKSIIRLKKLEKMEIDGTYETLTKKECIQIDKQRQKLEKFLGGIKEMEKLPDLLVIIDPNKEHIAVAEARKMRIPIVAVVDSNCNPELIDHPIPGNDDAIRSIVLFMEYFTQAVLEGESIQAREIAEAHAQEEGDASDPEASSTGQELSETINEATQKAGISEEVHKGPQHDQ